MARIKTDEEVATLRESGRRLGSVLKTVVGAVEPGISTQTLEDIAREEIEKLGDTPAFLHYQPKGAPRPYPAALCVSLNDEIVHGIPNEDPRELQEGDVVSFDIGLTHEGLITDTAYTVGVGEIAEENKRLIDTTKKALQRGIAEARAGKFVGDIGAAIEEFVREQGYGIYPQLVGHGVGHAVHEPPHIPNVGTRGDGPALEPGMVIAIEPMIGRGGDEVELLDDGYTYRTADGSISAHFEHTVVITDDDPEVLTAWEA